MDAPAALVQFVEPWSRVYGDSKILPTAIVFAHIAALVVAGGLAITMDRATLRAARGSADARARHLEELGRAHRVVIAGLALSVVTGVLLVTADLETYFVSPVYWTKMALIALLLTNGFLMTKTEARLRAADTGADPAWSRLRVTAAASMFLWFAIAFVGVALVKAA